MSRGILSANYSPVVDVVCRAMILAAIVTGVCAMPLYAAFMLRARLKDRPPPVLGSSVERDSSGRGAT